MSNVNKKNKTKTQYIFIIHYCSKGWGQVGADSLVGSVLKYSMSLLYRRPEFESRLEDFSRFFFSLTEISHARLIKKKKTVNCIL